MFIRSTYSINCVNQYDSRSMRKMWHKVPAGITDIHTRFRRPLIDFRKGASLPLLFFQNNNQDCVLCDLSCGQHEFDPLVYAGQGGSDCIVMHQNGSPPAPFVCFTHQTSAFLLELGCSEQTIVHV